MPQAQATTQSNRQNIPQTRKPPSSRYFSHDNISIYKNDILKITNIPKSSVDLIITSPPYNVDIAYNSHEDNASYSEYLKFTQKYLKKYYDLAKDKDERK